MHAYVYVVSFSFLSFSGGVLFKLTQRLSRTGGVGWFGCVWSRLDVGERGRTFVALMVCVGHENTGFACPRFSLCVSWGGGGYGAIRIGFLSPCGLCFSSLLAALRFVFMIFRVWSTVVLGLVYFCGVPPAAVADFLLFFS